MSLTLMHRKYKDLLPCLLRSPDIVCGVPPAPAVPDGPSASACGPEKDKCLLIFIQLEQGPSGVSWDKSANILSEWWPELIMHAWGTKNYLYSFPWLYDKIDPLLFPLVLCEDDQMIPPKSAAFYFGWVHCNVNHLDIFITKTLVEHGLVSLIVSNAENSV